MKILSFCVFSILSVHSAQIWTHPNVEAALPDTPLAPGAVQLNIVSIESEFPQNYIWFSGIWIGYFANEWRAPVWTTAVVAPPVFFDDSPQFERSALPVITVPGPSVPPTIIPPSTTLPVIHDLPITPDPDPSVVISNVPEPGFLTLWPLWIFCGVGSVVKRRIGL